MFSGKWFPQNVADIIIRQSAGLVMTTVTIEQKKRLFCRLVPDSYAGALANFFGSGPTDIELARKQHQAYQNALMDAGIEVHVLDADERHPDCIFVEDQALFVDGEVLIPNVGAPSREGERPPVEAFLREQLGDEKVHLMDSNAKMDGGDVIRLHNIFYVGKSSRTNDAGIDEFRKFLDRFGYELRVVNIPGNALHITSLSSTPTDDIIIAPKGYLTAKTFGELPQGCKVVMMPEEEAYGCNTIGLPGNKVLAAKGYPTVIKFLKELGLEVVEIDMSQIRAADGSLTCMSVFF